MKKIISAIFILTTTYFILNTFPVIAQSKVLINEFLIDPQPQSVEIFNSGTESADISDWIIDDSGGMTFYTIPKDSVVFPNQCLVFSGDFNLNKTSPDTIRFINNSQQLIDSFSYKSSSGSGVSYYRFPDNNDYWTTGSANLGFYNQTNITCLTTPTSTLTPTDVQMPNLGVSTTPTLTPTIELINLTNTPIQPTPTDSTDLTNIYLSEVMVNPPKGEKEWVEIYNDNDFPVSLNDWYIDDQESAGSSLKTFSLIINAKSYGVADLTSSIFNNDGDSVRLLDFNKDLKDDFEYQETETGKTLGRTSLESDNFCLQEPSKNLVNNPCINLTPTIVSTIGSDDPTPTIKISSNIKSTSLNKPVSINRLINTNKITFPTEKSGTVLGASDEIIINSFDNKPLINLLTFLSTSYSLLVIISVLIKSKVLNKYVLAS